jgi:uncharacterized membrane protein
LNSPSPLTSSRRTTASAEQPTRRAYIDCARGIAVLLMIEAHTLDAWTRFADRKTIAFRDATVLGGFAAPMFLWLAGLCVALAATRAAQRHGRREAIDAACRRGMEIFVLAFVFRLQALIFTPGGPLVNVFRVDVLNIMGPSIVAAALLWGLARTSAGRVACYTAAATLLAMATPIVRASAAVDALPIWLQWYVRPAGDLTTFTMLPWAAFVLAGGAVGVLIAAANGARSERRLHAALTAVGAALILAGFWTAGRPSIYLASSFWTTSPTWFAIRVGILMVALSAIYGVEVVFAFSWPKPLVTLGRASLFVYWIHVELVYGYASWLWRQRLPLAITALAYVAFCSLMYRAVLLRDQATGRWRSRRPDPSAQAATA